jgi:hypothetical protein
VIRWTCPIPSVHSAGRLPALLLALVLAAGQLLLAAHEVEHLAAGGTAHDCPLCLTGKGLDQALGADPVFALPAHPLACQPAPRASPWVASSPRAYRERAPPAVASTA